MKKLLAIILSLSVLVLFAGCAVQPNDYSSVLDSIEDVETGIEYESVVVGSDNNTTQNNTTNSNTTTNNNTVINKNNTTTNSNNTNASGNKNNVTSNKNNTTQKENSANIKLVYQKENRDHNFYDNWVNIDKIDISKNKMFIKYTATKYYGGGYDSFATDAIYYDANNNILDIDQVMYVSNFNNSVIGQSFVDETYIPNGTVTIVINSGTTATKPLVSSNHGNSNIKIDIPSVCYDKNNYGNSVIVNSYNVYDGKIFTTYTAKDYYGGGYDAHAVNMIFYNSSGGIIDTKQALYVGSIDNSIGCPNYDYTHIPDGTASIGIQMGTASNGSNSNQNSTTSSPSQSDSSESTPNEDNTKWTYSDAKTLDGYIEKAVAALKNAQTNFSKGSAFKALAASYVNTADGYIESAIALIESKSDITLSDGSTLLGKCKDAHTYLSQLDGITINMDNVEQHSETIRQMCYQGAVNVASIRILTSKLLLEF